MQNITTKFELKNAIQLLEIEQVYKGELVKEQFHLIYENLKPVNILKGTFKDIVTSPNLIENVLTTAIGLGTGYLSKKIVVGASSNLIRKFLGSILQLGVTNAVSQHPGAIKSIGKNIFQHIFRKKEKREKIDNGERL